MDQKFGKGDVQSCDQGDVNGIRGRIMGVVVAERTLSGMLTDRSSGLLTRLAGGEGGKSLNERL